MTPHASKNSSFLITRIVHATWNVKNCQRHSRTKINKDELPFALNLVLLMLFVRKNSNQLNAAHAATVFPAAKQ